jgi:hypothetical protein
MRIKLHIIVLALALALLPQVMHSQCLYEYFGKAGDTLYIGEDSRYNDTTAGPPYVQWVRVIDRDSTDEQGGRYWWFKNASPGTYYRQYADGSVDFLTSYQRNQYWYGMCDEPGYIRRNSGAMQFLGYDVIYLFRKPAWAMRYARYDTVGDSLIYTEYDYFVVPGFGEVLELETHHGIGQRRLVGAVVNGVRYGSAAITTSVDQQDGLVALRVEGSSIHIGGEIPPGSSVHIYTVQGQLQRNVRVNPYDVVQLDDLPRGIYFAVIYDASHQRTRGPVRVVVG